jgi:hypothetical protein
MTRTPGQNAGAAGVQVKGFLRDLGRTSAVMAERHDHWLRHQVHPETVLPSSG